MRIERGGLGGDKETWRGLAPVQKSPSRVNKRRIVAPAFSVSADCLGEFSCVFQRILNRKQLLPHMFTTIPEILTMMESEVTAALMSVAARRMKPMSNKMECEVRFSDWEAMLLRKISRF